MKSSTHTPLSLSQSQTPLHYHLLARPPREARNLKPKTHFFLSEQCKSAKPIKKARKKHKKSRKKARKKQKTKKKTKKSNNALQEFFQLGFQALQEI